MGPGACGVGAADDEAAAAARTVPAIDGETGMDDDDDDGRGGIADVDEAVIVSGGFILAVLGGTDGTVVGVEVEDRGA